MIKVENIDVWGFEHAIRGCRFLWKYDDRRTDKGNTDSNRQDREQTEKIRTTPTSQQTAETTEKGEQWQSKSYLTKIA